MNPQHTVCVDLIGPYSVEAKVQQLDNTIKTNEIKLVFMTFIDPVRKWFEIKEVHLKDLLSLVYQSSLMKFGWPNIQGHVK